MIKSKDENRKTQKADLQKKEGNKVITRHVTK